MAAFQHHLATIAVSWFASNNMPLTNDAEIELHALMDIAERRAAVQPRFLQGNVPHGTPELSQVEQNLQRYLVAVRNEAGGNPVTPEILQRARLSICPLFPIC